MFFIILLRALRIREKNDTLDCIKIKKVYLSKDIKTVKKQATEWGKLFAIHISNQRHVSRIYEVIPTNKSIEQSPQFLKMGKSLE